MSADTPTSRWPRRMLIGILVLAVCWTGLWFVAASLVRSQIEATARTLASRNIKLDCGGLSVGGFPFSLSVDCDPVALDDRVHGYRVTTAALNSGLSLPAPTVLRSRLVSPFRFETGADTVSATWSDLLLTADVERAGFDLATLEVDGLRMNSGPLVLETRAGQVQLRPINRGDETGNPSLQIAARLSDIVASTEEAGDIAPFALTIQATLQRAYQSMLLERQSLEAWLRSGAIVDIASLELAVEADGALVLSGTLSVGPDGLLNGDLLAGLSGTDALVGWAAQSAPELAPTLVNMGQAVTMIGQPATLAGRSFRAIPLTIRRGKVSVGFIQLAKVPRLL